MKILKGISAAPGVTAGVICLYAGETEDVVPHYTIEEGQIPAEIDRFRRALGKAKSEMEEMITTAMSRLDNKAVEVFNTHLLMLNDTSLFEKVVALMESRKINAEHAVSDVFEQYVQRYETEDGHFKELTHDFIDTRNRILNAFTAASDRFPCAADGPGGVIVAARRLTPSMVLQIPRENVLAFVTEEGGFTSHATILARAHGVPILFGIDVMEELDCGMPAIVDGSLGKVIVSPDGKTSAYYREKIQNLARKKNICKVSESRETRTRDGQRVLLKVNISTPGEANLIGALPHDGIGLLRTEFLFLRRHEPPTEEEQYAMYRRILEASPDRPVVARLLDIGADKLPLFLKLPGAVRADMELRGAMGVEAYPEIYIRQVKALLRANTRGGLRFLFPMVSDFDDLMTFRGVVARARNLLLKEKAVFNDVPVPEGVMLETPAAVMMAHELLSEVDFANIGSNDLLQYLMASSRGHAAAEERYHILHPSLMKMLEMAAAAGVRANKEVCLCGEIASFEEFYPLFLEAGLKSFSVAVSKFDDIKCEFMHVKKTEEKKALTEFYRTRSKEEAERFFAKFV